MIFHLKMTNDIHLSVKSKKLRVLETILIQKWLTSELLQLYVIDEVTLVDYLGVNEKESVVFGDSNTKAKLHLLDLRGFREIFH